MASTQRNLAVTVGLCLILGLPGITQGVEYTFTTVAHTGGQFSSFGEPMAPSVNDQGTVAFRGIRSSGGEGIYTGSGGPLATITETTGEYPSLGFYPVVGRNGEVAFWTRKESGLRNGEIFLNRNGSLISVAKPDAQFFDLGGPFEEPSIGAHGNVVFWNQTVDDIGPHDAITEWQDGTYTTRVFTPEGSITGLPGGGPSINARGEVAFYGQTTIGPEYFHLGIYKATATGITPIAVTGELFSGGFTGAPSINDQGVVAFKGGLASGMLGVFKGTGDVTVCVADTSGPFLNFSGDGTSGVGTPSINNLGTVAFFALLKDGRDGIFTGPDPTADKVITTGDALDGSTVDWLISWRDSLNNNGQLAFWAKLADGREGIYRADPVPEPASLLFLALGSWAVMRRRR